MTSYLLIVGDLEALGWVLTTGRMAFPSMNRREVQSLCVDDELFIYTTRKASQRFRQDRGRIIGTARVASAVGRLARPVAFGGRSFPVACDIEVGPLTPLGAGLELGPLVSQLQRFAGRGHSWPILLRRPLLELSADDAEFLRERLDGIEKDPNAAAAYSHWFVTAQASTRPSESPGS
jgi:hypothetical protein